jgi:hypothetical protein
MEDQGKILKLFLENINADMDMVLSTGDINESDNDTETSFE